MKYRVKNTIISHNKVLYPEGSIIDLEKKDAMTLKDFLDEISQEEQEQLEEESKMSKNSKKNNPLTGIKNTNQTTESVSKEINDDQNNETRSG